MRELNYPNVPSLFECYMPDDTELTIAMELVDGPALCDVGFAVELSEEHVAYITKELCSCLQHLHSKKIVHRDIKNPNVMLTMEGKVKVVDFGTSTKLGDDDRCRGPDGTPSCMAPEITSDKVYDEKVDIWPLGITVIAMIEKCPPRLEKGKNMSARDFLRFITEQGPPKLQKPASPELNDFVSKCICVNANDRASASELLEHKFLKKAGSAESLIPQLLKTRMALEKERKKFEVGPVNS